MGLLRRLGRRIDRRKVHILAVKLPGFVSPQRLHGQHRLPRVAHPLGELDAEQLRFLPQPAGADAEQKPPAAEVVQGGDFLGQQNGVALRHQADARAELQRAGNRRGPPQRHKGIHAFVVHLRDDPVRRPRPGGLGPGGNCRVFRHPQRLKAVPFASLRQLGNVNGGLGDEHCDANFHIIPSRDGLLTGRYGTGPLWNGACDSRGGRMGGDPSAPARPGASTVAGAGATLKPAGRRRPAPGFSFPG